MVWPLAYVQVTVQAVMAELPAVTFTSPWKPLGHEPTIEYPAVHDLLPPVVGEGLFAVGLAEGEADRVGDADAEGELVGDDVAVGDALVVVPS
jgi:hypothetical protein